MEMHFTSHPDQLARQLNKGIAILTASLPIDALLLCGHLLLCLSIIPSQQFFIRDAAGVATFTQRLTMVDFFLQF
jgi:hypothetical protein